MSAKIWWTTWGERTDYVAPYPPVVDKNSLVDEIDGHRHAAKLRALPPREYLPKAVAAAEAGECKRCRKSYATGDAVVVTHRGRRVIHLRCWSAR